MPKRVATPPLPDNTYYFTVTFPYPLGVNWELEEDQSIFARWIACIVPRWYFTAIMYKPSARGMVLIEVDREFQDVPRLLGEHKWEEFLKNPTEEEKPCSTKVFFSTYSTHRGAQKDGWLTINVQDNWFEKLDNRIITTPYPRTHWCPLPIEDQTNKPMCRHLPNEHFPPPLKESKPVVGSSQWAGKGTSSTSPVVGSAQWAAKTTAPNTNSREAQRSASNKTRPGIATKPTPMPNVIRPVANNSGARRPTSNAWGTPKNVAAAGATQNTPTPVPSKPKPPQGAWGANKPAAVTSVPGVPRPPGLPAPPRVTVVSSTPPGVVRQQSTSSSPDSAAKSPTTESSEEVLLELDEEDEVDHVPYELPSVVAASKVKGQVARSTESVKKADPLENDSANTTSVKGEKLLICPTHGLIQCKKGVCKDKADMIRKMEREEREAKGESPVKKRQGNRGGRWKRGAQRHEDRRDDNDESVDRGTPQNGSSNPGSQSGSPENSTQALLPDPVIDHDDETDPWLQF